MARSLRFMCRPPKSINRFVVTLGLASLFTDMASEMLYPIMPMYITGVLGASMLQLGLLEGAAEALASILKAFFGSLSDAYAKRAPFVVLGYTLSAISKPLPALLQCVQGVVIARLSDRLGKAIRSAPRDALLAEYAPKDEQGTVFGFHRAMDTAGAAIGPAFGLVYLYFYPGDYVPLFLIAFIPSLAAVGMTFLLKDAPSFAAKASKGVFFSKQREVFSSSPVLRRLLLAVFLFSLVNSSDVFLIMRAREQGFSDAAAVGAYIFYNLLYAALSFPLGGLSDKYGKDIALRFGLIAYVVTYLLFAAVSASWSLVLGFMIYAFYAASTESIIKAWVSELSPAYLKASAFGLLTTLMSIGMLVASVLAGWLWDSMGPSAPFYLAACGALCAFVLIPHYGENGLSR